MPKSKPPQIHAWSYSRWQTYDGCPARAKYAYIDKLVDQDSESSPALVRGSEIHAAARDFVTKADSELPKSLELFDDEFAIMRRAWSGKREDVFVEEQWAYDVEWLPTEWFAPTAWMRVVLDALVVDRDATRALVIDYKTGKIRPERHQGQLSLYALAVMARFEKVEHVHASLWYLDHGRAHGASFKRSSDLERLKKEWLGRINAMLSDRHFEPRPSGDCRFCPYSKAKHGPCRY